MYRPVQQCDISVDKNIQTLQNNTQVRNKMSTSTAEEDYDFMDTAAQFLNNNAGDNEPIRRRLANMDSSDEENDDRRTVFSEYDNNSNPDLSSDYQLLEPPIPQQPPTQYQQPQPPIQQPPTQYQPQPQPPIPQQPPTQYQPIQRQPQQPIPQQPPTQYQQPQQPIPQQPPTQYQQPQPPIPQQPPTQYQPQPRQPQQPQPPNNPLGSRTQPQPRQPQQPQPPNNPVGNQTRTGGMDGLNIEDALEDLNDTSTNGPGVSNDRSIKPSSGNRIKLTADINSPSSNNNSGKHTRFSNNNSTDPNIPPSKRFKLPNPPNFNQNGNSNTKNQGGDVLDYKPVNMNTKPKIGAPNPPAGINAPIDGFFGTQNNNGFQNMNNNGFQNMNNGNSGNNNGFQNMNSGNNNGSQDLVCAVPSNSASLRFGLNNSIPAYPYTTTCMNNEYAQNMIQALYQLASHIINNSIETIFIWDNTIVLGNAKKYGTSNRKPNIQIPSMLGNIKISRRNIANDDEMSIIMICPNETSGINQWVGLMYRVPEFKQAIDQFNAQMLVRWASFSNTTYEDALLKYVKLLNNYIMLNSDKSSYALLSARSLSSNNSNFNQNNGFQNMNSMNSSNNGFQNMNSGNNNGFQNMNSGNNNGFQNMNSMNSSNNGFQGMQSMNSNSNNQSMQGSKLLPEYTLWNSASSVNEQYAGTITDPNTSTSMIEYNPPILTQNIDCHQKYEIIRSFLENTDMKLVPRKKKSKKNSS